MKTFKEFVEERELNEGVIDTVLGAIGKLLGIGTAGVLSAWLAALLFKGGVSAVNSFSDTLGKSKQVFKKNFNDEVKTSPAVKKELDNMRKLENKYEEELSEILTPLRQKNFNEAATAFKNLPKLKQESTEIRRFVIEEIVKTCGQIPASVPTPGNEAYKVIKSFTNLATAKAIADSFQKEALRYISKSEE